MDEEAAKTTKVKIFGEELGIKSQASPEYTRQVADFVDKAMEQVANVTRLTDVHRIAILAAMSIADEFFQTRDKVKRIDRKWESEIGVILQYLRKTGDKASEGKS
jgi:cell division protein ZapA